VYNSTNSLVLIYNSTISLVLIYNSKISLFIDFIHVNLRSIDEEDIQNLVAVHSR